MRRYALTTALGTGAALDPFRPNVTGSYVALGYIGGRALVKTVVADGTAADADTLADLVDGTADVTPTTLAAGARTTIKTRLTSLGFDISQFDADGVDDRRKLLAFVLRRVFGWSAAQIASGLHLSGFDLT